MNGHYVRQLPLDELYNRSKNFWPPEAGQSDEAYKKAILGLLQERLKFLGELPELVDFFFNEPKAENLLSLFRGLETSENINRQNIRQMIETTNQELSKSNFRQEDIKARLNKLLGDLSSRPAILFSIVRIAISGTKTSPELFGTLNVLGKDRALKRLETTASVLEKQA
jgi:glutamyl/glutaminyl-tRNA synthetase